MQRITMLDKNLLSAIKRKKVQCLLALGIWERTCGESLGDRQN